MNLQVNTKLKISKPVSEVFEAIVDPAQMSHYWFSSGSERLQQGRTITWRYEEYNAEVEIYVLEIETNKKIVYSWAGALPGADQTVRISLKEVDKTTTIIEVNEEGFTEEDDALINTLLDQKEGWTYMLTCMKGYLEYGANLRASLVR